MYLFLHCHTLSLHSALKVGLTKLFLKDADDQFLEDERDRILTKKVVIIQKWVKGYFTRRRFLALRRATLVLQKNYRMHAARRRWIIVSLSVDTVDYSFRVILS